MTPLAWLLGLLLPACGAPGAQGLPVPPPMDIAHITRPASPNTALAAPAGFSPAPDIVTPTYPVPAARLYAAIQAVAAAQPRTYQAAAYPDRLQAALGGAQRGAQLPRPGHRPGHAQPARTPPHSCCIPAAFTAMAISA